MTAVPWTGRWIWAGTREDVVVLRRSFELDAVPAAVPARVTADSRYVLQVNGTEVSRGPARSIPERLAYHELDLTSHLRPGTNVIAALVRYYGDANRWWRPALRIGQLGRGGFLFEAPAIGVASDSSWQGSGLALPGGDGERWVAAGWDAEDLEESRWSAAVELQAPPLGGMSAVPPCPPYAAMEPTAMAELTAIARPANPAGDGAAATFDIGEQTHGTVVVTVRAAAGVAVEVSVGEDLGEDGRAIAAPRNWTAAFVASGDDTETFETFDPIGFRYLTVDAGDDVEVVAAGVVERRYPTTGRATFTSDDPRLDTVWSVGARTLELCALDAFVDCPGREQNSWIGDSYLHTLVAMVTNADWRLVRRNLRLGAQARRPDGFLSAISTGGGTTQSFNIPEYSLHWIRALTRYVERSGDLATARELLPAAMDVVAAFERHRGDDGLLRSPAIVFVDWAQTERGSVTGAVDALYGAALLDHARLLELVLGDDGGAAVARELHLRTAESLEQLWDDDRGVYVDASHDGAGPGRRVSQQTNALAIVGRCAPPERWSRVLDAVLDTDRVKRTLSNGDLPERDHWQYQRWEPANFDAEHDVVLAQPFMAHFLHQAVADAGLADRIAGLCLRWWPQVERGNTTFEEFWDAPPGTTSRCHAWSATPTFDLTTHVLGIRPIIESADDLGFRRAIVAPAFGHLHRVSGRVPTPAGDLVVDLAPEGGTIEVPEGMHAVSVHLPGLEPRTLAAGSHRLG